MRAISGLCKCQACQSQFPLIWVAQSKNGACQIGAFKFCCQKCAEHFLANNLLPKRMGRDIQFALELKKLQNGPRP